MSTVESMKNVETSACVQNVDALAIVDCVPSRLRV